MDIGTSTVVDTLVVVVTSTVVVTPVIEVASIVAVANVVALAVGNSITPSFASQHVLLPLPQHHDPSAH